MSSHHEASSLLQAYRKWNQLTQGRALRDWESNRFFPHLSGLLQYVVTSPKHTSYQLRASVSSKITMKTIGEERSRSGAGGSLGVECLVSICKLLGSISGVVEGEGELSQWGKESLLCWHLYLIFIS